MSRTPFDNHFAFIVGINSYQHLATLTTAEKDANELADLLEKSHGYTVFRYLGSEGKGTKKGIEEMFKDILDKVGKNDRVIVYFAGHGIAINSETDPKGYLVPSDASTSDTGSLVDMDDLLNTLNQVPKAKKDSSKATHGLLILDCCYSGAFKWSVTKGNQNIFRDGTFSFGQPMYSEHFWRFVDNPAWQVITSSAADQKAVDILSNKALGHRDPNSPFAKALMEAIGSQARGDLSIGGKKDGVITVSELELYIREKVEKLTTKFAKRQTPNLFALKRHSEKGEFIFFDPNEPPILPDAPNINPYKGLQAYQHDDARLFYGREQEIDEMVEKLADSEILVVSAPSGQGKSSVVQAGLFSQLEKAKKGEDIHFHVVRPGNAPYSNLAKVPTFLKEENHVLLIDQYEEFFTHEDYGSEHEFFEKSLKNILEQAKNSQGKHKLIITIRADFEWEFKTSKFGEQFWVDKDVRPFLYRLPPVSKQDLRKIMVLPAKRVAYTFESEEMIDQILDEVQHAPGALPILSFCLNKLFERCKEDGDRVLKYITYTDDLHGINGAMSTHADEFFNEGNVITDPDAIVLRSDEERAVMRKLMLRMVRLNDGSYSRRKVYRNIKVKDTVTGGLVLLKHRDNNKVIDELDFPDHEDKIVKQVLNLCEQQHLLAGSPDELGDYIEPMHDSLINHWPRFLGWIKEFGRETLELQRKLWQACLEHHGWEESEYDTSNAKARGLESAKPHAPLWNNNPKLSAVQLATTDPKDLWLCKQGWAGKSLSSFTFLLENKAPTDKQSEELKDYERYFLTEAEKQSSEAVKLSKEEIYQRVCEHMDNWLNEVELDFVMKSFEAEQTALERAIRQRDEAIQKQNEILELAHKLGIQTQAFKKKFQEQTRKDFHYIKKGIKPNLHMIMAGIDNYGHIPKLLGCVNDVNEMEKAFQSQEGKLYNQVFSHKFLDQKAHKDKLTQTISAVKQEVQLSDFVLVFLSGHGTKYQQEVKPGVPPKEDGAFIFSHYNREPIQVGLHSCITGKETCDLLLDFPCKVILIVDIVNGGEFLSSLVDCNQSDTLEKLAHNVFGLSSCGPNEMAHEIRIEGQMRGTFSYFLGKCFTTQEADLDNNGVLYLDELVSFTTKKVKEKHEKQNVYSVVPATMTNIPLIQFGEEFALPEIEIPLTGHIEEDAVIEGIMHSFTEGVPPKALAKFQAMGPWEFIDTYKHLIE